MGAYRQGHQGRQQVGAYPRANRRVFTGDGSRRGSRQGRSQEQAGGCLQAGAAGGAASRWVFIGRGRHKSEQVGFLAQCPGTCDRDPLTKSMAKNPGSSTYEQMNRKNQGTPASSV